VTLASGPSRAIYATRGLRAVADGLMSTSLATLLGTRGFSARSVGLVSTATLLGSASALLIVTRFAHQLKPLRVLIGMSILMAITGLAFAAGLPLWVLLLVAVCGPLNPSSGDVSAFLPAEQTVLGSAYEGSARTRALARLTLVAAGGAAAGAFLAGPLGALGRRIGFDGTRGTAFLAAVYGLIGLAVLPIYVRVAGANRSAAVSTPQRLGPSRSVVIRLASVFALDSAGGGLVVYSIIALWLRARFGFELGQVGAALGSMSLAAAASSQLAPRLADRFGLVETMVFTHLPANLLLIAAAFAPTPLIAVTLLILRSLMSQLDVAPRVSLVMSLVTPAERSAASAFTNLPRSLATASTPLLGAWMLEHSTIGWPLVAGGVLKIVYDILLWVGFRHRSPGSG
jgi:predicted MFS family arabinose efflux permease